MSFKTPLKAGIWKIYVFISVMLTIPELSSSQMLEPGNKMPEIKVKYTQSGELKELNFSDLKGKLVILDFWNIWCSACIGSMTKLDSLQKKYSSKIQIVLVTNNTMNEVEKVFRRPFLKGIKLPMVIQDSVLVNYFPHETVPHHVWIMPDAMIKYITYGDNTTEKNINSVLSGEFPELSYKKEVNLLDFSKPLWSIENQSFARHISYYSYIANRIEEYGGGGRVRIVDSATKSIVGIRAINQYLLSLYQIAYGGFDYDAGEFQNTNRILIELKDKTLLIEPGPDVQIDEWKRNNIYSYELRLPVHKGNELYSTMREDLRRYFPFAASIQKRKVCCLILVRTSQIDKMASKGGVSGKETKGEKIVIRNLTFKSSVARLIQYANSNLRNPILDETGYNGRIDINLPGDLNNLPVLKEALNKYDLDLIEAEREIDMLVIEDKQ